MLWTDKTTINEFLKDNPLNQELYKTFVKLKGDSLFITLDAEQVFDEVYYQLARMSYENPQSFDINSYIEDIKLRLQWSYGADLVLSMMYVVASLTPLPHLSLNQKKMKAIEEKCWYGLFWHPFMDCLKRLKKKDTLRSKETHYYNNGKSIVLSPHQLVLNAPKAKVNIIMDNHGNIICK